MNPLDILPLALLGAIVGMDVVTFPQAMISRPIVAATAAGAFIGHPEAGLVIGAVLELLALEMLPFGASRYPEWGSASVVGGALFAAQAGGTAGSLAIALLASLVTAMASGWSMVRLRRMNGTRTARERKALDAGSVDAIVGMQLFGLTADFVRGGLLTLVAIAAFNPMMRAIAAQWGTSATYTGPVVVLVVAAVSAGAIWRIFHGVHHARILFLAGLAVGASLLGRG